MSGILSPLKGKTLSCSGGTGVGSTVAYAMVDSSGTPFSKITVNTGSTTWVSGFTVSKTGTMMTGVVTWNTTELIATQNGSIVCRAIWPAN